MEGSDEENGGPASQGNGPGKVFKFTAMKKYNATFFMNAKAKQVYSQISI